MECDIEKFAQNMRRNIIELTYRAGNEGAHIGGALSSTDILAVLYCKIMNYNINNPLDENRDRFILSKGHTAIGLYAALYECGLISEEDLYSFEKDGSKFQTHCVINPQKGIEISSGSLGWGLSVAVGMQLASQRLGNKYYNYVLLGNGECNEGSVWESAMLASHLKLNRLIAILDNNHMQLDGDSDSILTSRMFSERFRAFGWNVLEVDGHDINALQSAFKKCKDYDGTPSIIIADTIKGKGISFLENSEKSHHMIFSKEDYEMAMREVGGSVKESRGQPKSGVLK